MGRQPDKDGRNIFWAALLFFCATLTGLSLYKFVFNPPAEDPAHLGGSRFLVAVFLSTLGFLFLARFQQVVEIVRKYFAEASHPMDLAIFRIALFAAVLSFDAEKVIFYSGFPRELLFPIFGSGWLINLVPINEAWAGTAVILLKVFCWLGLLGIFTRFSAPAAALLYVYVGGIPQFFGNVNHYHNLLWFMAVLAVSRCGDYLSVDAIRQAIRQADAGDIVPPRASRVYGLPLRFIWLLFGVAYFGPGFWKLWRNGTAWIFGDNLMFHMYCKWMDFENWTPFFRIDHYPILCRMGGAFAIFFETSFIFLIFFAHLRWIAVAGGLTFHTLTGIFMRIPFENLRNLYIVFVPWDRFLGWVGKKLFRQEMTLFYDGNCGICRRTVAVTKRFDLLGRIHYVNALSAEGAVGLSAAGISQEAALHDMHAVLGSKITRGYDAYRTLSWRIPVLWPLSPLMYLGPVAVIGRRVYRKVADSRTCRLPGSLPKPDARIPAAPSLRPVMIVGGILVAANFYCGLLDIGAGWPFAGYPTFSNIHPPVVGTLEIEVTTRDGKTMSLSNSKLGERCESERFTMLISKVLYKDPSLRNQRLAAIWQVMTRLEPELKSVKSVQFYDIQRTIIPEEKNRNPLRRTLIYQLQLK